LARGSPHKNAMVPQERRKNGKNTNEKKAQKKRRYVQKDIRGENPATIRAWRGKKTSRVVEKDSQGGTRFKTGRMRRFR